MKTKTIIALLTLTLAACTSAQTPPAINLAEVQNTAIAAAWTDVTLTQTALPTTTPLSPTLTLTPDVTIIPTTPIPTLPPIIMITPDTIQ